MDILACLNFLDADFQAGKSLETNRVYGKTVYWDLLSVLQ